MELNYFKDNLFDLLNESDEMDISDIDSDDRNALFIVSMADGSMFEIVCRQVTEKEGEWKNAD